MKKLTNSFSMICFVFALAWKKNRLYLYLLPFLIITGALLPYPFIIFPKMILDSLLLHRQLWPTTGYVIALVISTLMLELSNNWLQYRKQTEQYKLKLEFEKNLSEAMMQMPYERMEDPELIQKAQRASAAVTGDVSWSVVKGLSGDRGLDAIGSEFVNISVSILRIAGFLAILSGLHPVIIALLIAAVIVNAFCGTVKKRADFTLRNQTAQPSERYSYAYYAANDPIYGKDIRLFSMQSFLISKCWESRSDFFQIRKQLANRYLGSDHISALTNCAQDLCTYLYLIRELIAHRITVGAFYLYANTIAQFSASLTSLLYSILNLNLFADYMADYKSMLAEVSAQAEETTHSPSDWEKPVISFDHVWFRYPGSDSYTLEDVSIDIPAHTKLSIVGQNGAGKSTFVKLLLRLYTPTEGRILLNGVDIQGINRDEYISHISAIFQDYNIYAFSVEDNIGFDRKTETAIDDIIEKTGLSPLLSRLPEGKHTIVSKVFTDQGVELSQGQRQRLAIARALYKKAGIVVMDEPTAALDPIAEYNLYKDFHRLVDHQTVLYISHRLSSCRFCDTIAVFERGKIIEVGTHDELFARGGLYAEMFSEQASNYTEEAV